MASNTRVADRKNAPIDAERVMEAAHFDERIRNVQWNGLIIRIKPCLSLSDATEMLSNIISSCTYGDKPLVEMLDFAMRIHTMIWYTNISLPDKIDDQYKLMYETDLFDAVLQHINAAQYHTIRESAGYYLTGM